MDPANPLWEFSLAVYGQPGVEQAAVSLQDKLGIDVNLLLACCWAAQTGLQLDSGFFQSVFSSQAMAEWNTGVIQVLRKLRRRLKVEPVSRVQTLRQQILQAEISSERVYQDLLLELMADDLPQVKPEPGLLYRNLHTYWRGLDLGAPVWEDVLPFIKASFVDHDLGRLRDQVEQGMI